jgi:hypothetical protein
MHNALDNATASVIDAVDGRDCPLFLHCHKIDEPVRPGTQRGGAVITADEPIAAIIAFVLGTPCGAFLVLTRLPGRTAILVLANALFGLPPVVVGLLYLILSQCPAFGKNGGGKLD